MDVDTGKPDTPNSKDRLIKCEHDYHRTGYGSARDVEYECRKCGDTYERDVS